MPYCWDCLRSAPLDLKQLQVAKYSGTIVIWRVRFSWQVLTSLAQCCHKTSFCHFSCQLYSSLWHPKMDVLVLENKNSNVLYYGEWHLIGRQHGWWCWWRLCTVCDATISQPPQPLLDISRTDSERVLQELKGRLLTLFPSGRAGALVCRCCWSLEAEL